MARIQLPVHSYALRSTPASPSRLVNCYAEQLPPDAKDLAYLTRSPGIASWSTVGTGAIYGLHAALDRLYVVSGSKLYEVDSNKNATELGTIGSPNRIDIDSNTDSVVVVNEPDAYYWDGTTFGQITDSDFTSRGAGDVEFVNNYLLFREPDSGRFFGADLGSATSFDALNFATAEGSPDEMVGLKVDHLNPILFGTKSMEIWENVESAGFPFTRAINGYIEQGCINGETIAKLDNTVFFVGEDYTVRRLEGATPRRISTHYIEQRLTDGTTSSATGFAYKQDGHLFYVLTIPEGTFVYDATTDLWHERESYGESLWSPKTHAQVFGLELVGDSLSNKIGYLDAGTYADFGSTQVMQWTYQPIFAEQHRAFHDRLEILFEPGVGLTSGQGSEPVVSLEFSDDGGLTWDFMPDRSLGEIGEYGNRVVWHSLGSSRQRVYRASVSDPVKVVVMGTYVEVRGGRL